MRRRLLVIARSVLLGCVALAAVAYLARPLEHWTARLLGVSWVPTVALVLQCVALGAAGWAAGRWNQHDEMPSVIALAALVAVWNFGLVPAMDIAWLLRLTRNTLGSLRYLESLITSLATHALLFGSLFVGARLSRRIRTQPLSIAGSSES